MGDSISVDQEEIRNSFEHYFSDLFKETQSWHPKLDRIQFDMLEEGEARALEKFFTEEKVYQALNSIDSDNLDDFTIDFFQKCWNVVRGDIIMWFFHNFHHREMFEVSLNATFISLIPKKSGGYGVKKYFKPISPIGSVYKIFAKVLANRLKKVLDKLISNTQMLLWATGKF